MSTIADHWAELKKEASRLYDEAELTGSYSTFLAAESLIEQLLDSKDAYYRQKYG